MRIPSWLVVVITPQFPHEIALMQSLDILSINCVVDLTNPYHNDESNQTNNNKECITHRCPPNDRRAEGGNAPLPP